MIPEVKADLEVDSLQLKVSKMFTKSGVIDSVDNDAFQSAILRWAKDIENILQCEKTTLWGNPCMQLSRAKTLLSVVSKVGLVLRSFLKKFPKIEAVTCNVLLFGGASVAIADLFLDDLVIRIQNATTSTGVLQAKTFAEKTFLDVKPRLDHLDTDDGQVFGQTDHHRRMDIEHCIGKLNEVKPMMGSCTNTLDRSSMVASTLSGLFGVAGLTGLLYPGVGWSLVCVSCILWVIMGRVSANYGMLKHNFVTYQETCQEINDGLIRKVKMRMDSGQSIGSYENSRENAIKTI